MATFSNNLGLTLIGNGEQAGQWGDTTNTNLGTLIEQAITGYITVSILDADYTLTNTPGASNQSLQMGLNIVSSVTLTATRNIIVPTGALLTPITKLYVIKNATSGGQSITVKYATGSGVTIPNGATNIVLCNGTNVVEAYSFGVPSGVITMWSGSIVSIPAGWFLCDGTNGTPNLRDRFIVGAGSTYSVGNTGGSANATLVSHSHTVSGSGSTGTAGSHGHGVNDPGHNHSVNDPGHSHTNTTGTQILSNGTAVFLSGYANNGTTNGAATGISLNGALTGISIAAAGDHTHSVSVTGSTSTDGASATNANLPPYYALAYIMKA
jgi:hypothetical protein